MLLLSICVIVGVELVTIRKGNIAIIVDLGLTSSNHLVENESCTFMLLNLLLKLLVLVLELLELLEPLVDVFLAKSLLLLFIFDLLGGSSALQIGLEHICTNTLAHYKRMMN